MMVADNYSTILVLSVQKKWLLNHAENYCLHGTSVINIHLRFCTLLMIPCWGQMHNARWMIDELRSPRDTVPPTYEYSFPRPVWQTMYSATIWTRLEREKLWKGKTQSFASAVSFSVSLFPASLWWPVSFSSAWLLVFFIQAGNFSTKTHGNVRVNHTVRRGALWISCWHDTKRLEVRCYSSNSWGRGNLGWCTERVCVLCLGQQGLSVADRTSWRVLNWCEVPSSWTQRRDDFPPDGGRLVHFSKSICVSFSKAVLFRKQRAQNRRSHFLWTMNSIFCSKNELLVE